MTNQQSTLMSLAGYEIAARGEEYNPVVVFDTVNVLSRRHSSKDLALMITDEHKDFPPIGEAIRDILDDTYSVAAVGFHMSTAQRSELLMNISAHLSAAGKFSVANAYAVMRDVELYNTTTEVEEMFDNQSYMDEVIAFNILDCALTPVS
jgi:hypothetical protein